MTDDQKRQKSREVAARHRANPNNTIKLRYLKARYGLTIEQYEQMVKDQEGLCKICRGPPTGRWKRLAVDHDHVTGKVRGLLCHTCNSMLGHARDRLGVLEAAIRYLQESLEEFIPSPEESLQGLKSGGGEIRTPETLAGLTA